MAKDCSKYLFKGKLYGKGRLVEAVVTDYILAHKNITYSELTQIFSADIQQVTKLKVASFDVVRETSEISENQSRHYFSDEIQLADTKKIRINRGWDKDNIVPFIKKTEELGYKIKKIED
ncbi:MAG: hypothetical protein J6I53_00450 [Treponema sp.]|nr:hypothetical protein [Treponema sp.]